MKTMSSTGSSSSGFLSHEEFLSRLENVNPTAQGHKAKCPLHDSKSGQNLSIKEVDGKTLTHCFSERCKFEDIVEALQKKVYTREQVYRGRVFGYTDLAGELVTTHKHRGAWYLPYGDKFIAKEPENRPLFNYPEVADAVRKKKTVFICEGEKDCATADDLGWTATTSGGANTWAKVLPYISILTGADVVVIPDNDGAGEKYKDAILLSLLGIARNIKVLNLTDLMPDLPPGGDLTDYIEAGGTRGGIEKHLNSITSVTPTSVSDLMSRTLPDITFTVEGILPEGVSLLAGKPKKGKSWLALGLCLQVAAGKPALGGRAVSKGKSLYLALEDNERRMQRRLRKILGNQPPPKDMFYSTRWPRLEEGGAAQLERWLRENPDTKLVVIDTLAKVRKPARGQAIYQEDYSALESLLPIAAAHQVAILVVHHLRQLPGVDPQDEISGSSGLTGGVDGWMILRRSPGASGPTLLVDGRDIEHSEEYALEWNSESATWSIVGVAEQVHLSETRRQILGILEKGRMSPKEVHALLPELKYDNVKGVMRKMLEDDQLLKDEKGKYGPTESNKSS
jgi:AAA domain